MKKRVLSMLMTLALCLTLFPAPAWAAEDTPEGGAIVQQEQQEEISPAVSEQAGTNEEENGSEGDPQNTGTPDAGGAEDSKADAPEIGEDENAGNNADAAVSAVQTMIDALPTVSELDGMTADELDAAYDDIQAAYDAYEALNAEQQAQITGVDFEALFGWFNSQTAPLTDAQSGVHTHCVCGKDSSTTVNGHTHNTGTTTWTATDALPSTAGSYYLTKSVSENWTVPTDGEVNLCLNGQTINGKITVGSGATLTLTDCSDSGRVQGEVLVNGGKLELYSGTITGGVQVGKKGADYQTGSSFTMYGGAITGNEDYGGVFLVGTTNHIAPPNFTMHGGTISNNTAGASDGGGGGVYVGEKCSFTMDGGTITGNTATAGNGGGIYIHFNAGNVSISNAAITGNKASATGDTRYGHGGGIYSERGVTVKNVTITGNNSTFAGGGIYGKGAITLTDATVTDNNQYDVYYDGTESTNPKLTVSGSVKAGYYANYDWKLPILVSGALSEDSVIRVGVREGINPGAIAEPASGMTLSAENFKADAADSVTSLGKDGKVYLVPCTHEMDDTGYTCKKCHTQFDARVGDSAYYQTLTKAFDAARGSTVTLLRNVTLTENCSSSYTYPATLDLNGKTVSSGSYPISVGGGNKPMTLTVMNSGTGGGTQALNVKFWVASNGTLAVDNSYTGKISRVELQAGGALERFGGEIGELVLSNAAAGSTSTGYNLKLWKDNTNACTIGKITDSTKSKSLTVNDLLGTDYAKCELYGEKDSAWSIVPKTKKISELTGYTAYKVQFPECVHQCADDSNPVCSVCHKKLYTKITAKTADGTTKTAYFTEDSALENGYVEAIQTLNGWSNEGCTEPTLTLLRDMYAFGTSMPLTGTLTLEGGTHTAKNVTVAEGADVTFASGSYKGATIDGTATVKESVTFTSTVTVNGTLNAKGGTFDGPVEFNGSSTANISGGSFNNEKKYGGVEFDYNVTGTISGGTFVLADFYTTKVKLSGGTFTMIKTNGDRKLADLLAEGAAYYNGDSAVSNDNVASLTNVTVKSHEHNGGTDGNGTCSICGKKMAASLTVGGKTSWYTAFATAIEAANAADGEKTITLYQDVNGYVNGHSTTYELTRGPVTLATGGKKVMRANLTAKDISLTVTGSNGDFNVTVDGKDAELTVNDGNTKLAIVTAQNGGKLSLSNGTFSRVAVKDDGSSASLSGGSYDEITSDEGYVKPYALLAKGYAYKKTKDNQWLPNANSIPSKVTVEKAPFAVEKIYPNNNKDYTGSSAFATDGNITLTAVIAPETEGDTYYYWWELFDESKNDWTTSFKKVNTATHTGGQSKTLTISGLPVDKSYQYHIFVQCSNGYNCYSEPFTVTQHQHSWTYTASGATITAKCTAEGCCLTDGNGGSVTIAAPAELTYSGESKPATVTASSDWQGPAASGITISYIKSGKYIQQLENGALPTNAGEYTASITVGEATASVTYTIGKATPKAEDFTFTAPTSLTYDGNVKSATVSSAKAGTGDVIVKYYDKDGQEATPKNAGEYTVKIDVAEGTNYAAANGLTADGWKFSITKAAAPTMQPIELTVINGLAKTYLVNLPALPTLGDNCKYGSIKYEACNFDLIGEGGYANSTAMITSNDEFQLTVPAVESQTEGSVGTVGVKITTDNYQDMLLTVEVIAKNKIVPVLDGKITATPITFGQILRVSTITGTMKDDGNTVEGTFEWTNPSTKPDKAGDYQAEWTFTPAEGYEEYATATGTVTIKVKPAKLTVSVNASRMYYTGKAQIASIIASGQSVDSTPVTFTYSDNVDGNYTSGGPTFTDAGTYTVYYKAEAANHEPATGTFTVTIDPLPISLLSVSSISKTYDGSADVTLTADKLTFFSKTANIKLPDTALSFSDAQFTSKQADGSYLPSPEVGGGKALSFTMTLTSKNYVFEGESEGTTEVSDVFATDDANRFTITKATAPTGIQTGTLNVINGTTLEYTYDAKQILPAAPNGTYGTVLYSGEPSSNFESGYTVNSFKVGINSGVLTLTIDAQNGGKTGKIGSVTIYVTTDNYEIFNLPLDLYAVNQIKPVPDGKITASEITYGNELSASTITGTMKDPNTSAPVDGTFAWTDGTIKPGANDSYKAEWTFTPAAGYEKYATATGTVTVKVNKATIPANAITAPAANALTYNGNDQALITAGSVTSGGTMQYSLTENGTYSQNIPVGTDAGTYTVWYRVIGDANHNDTAPASVAVSIGKKPLTITGVTVAPKPYDGTTNADISSVTFDGVNLNRGTDYTVTANFDDAGVGNGKNVTATVTLTEQTAKNYALEQSSFPTTGNITKAAAPTVQPVELTIYNGVQKVYFVDLPSLPPLDEGKSYGTVEYRKTPTINLSEGYIAQSELAADPENLNTLRLLLRMKQTGSLTGEIGTVTIPVTTSNYQDINLTVKVSAVNQIKPEPDGTITASEITYGNELSMSTITGKMKDPDTGDAVKGTFTWMDGTVKPDAGSNNATWTFTPDASYGEKYTTNNGTATVTVNRKTVTVSGITAKDKAYDGNTNAVLNYSAVTLDGILENDTLTVTAKGVFEKADIGKQKVTISDLTLGGASAANYVLAESGNQSETTATITAREVTVTITSKGGTYGSVVAAAAKLTGAVDGDNVPVTLTYTGNNYSSATVPVNVGSYTVTASIANSNYTLTGKTTAAFVITPKAVTVSGITANDKVYDGTNDATLDCSNAKFGGVLENDTLTVTAKGMFEKADVGEQKVRISDLTLDGASAANYVLAGSGNQAETTATITAKEVTVTITPNGGTYGETITPATVTANGVVGEDAPKITLTYTGTANDGTKYTGTTPPTKAGTYTITATITNPNYKLDADTATAEFTVAKRPATVTPDSKSKVYEEKDPKLTYIVSGVLSGETLKGITLARAEGENAGEYDITGTAASANPNYDVKFVKGTFTIEPKSIQGATVVLGKGLAANGAEQTQTVEKVLLGDKEIPADSYTVTGNTATAHGIYTLTITAKGNYTDSIAWTYVIAPSKAEDAPGEDIAIDSGKVKVVVLPEGAVPSVGLLTDKAELLAMLVNSGDITADELVQIANGASVDIVLTVKEANVLDEVKTAMAQAAKGYTIGQYLDISLFKYMTVNGNRQPGAALRTTKNALTISVAVPDALINTNSAVNRTYCIVRRHDGAITVLDAAFDAASKTLTFKTDRFSIYAIAYKDTAVPSSGSNPGSNNSSNDSETKKNEVAAPTPAPTPASTSKPSTITAMPQTGDTSNPTLYVVLLVASLLGLAVVFVCKKRNDK